MARGHELPRGVSGHAPSRIFLKMNMRCDAIWCILRHNFEKCYNGALNKNTPCSLSYSVLRQGILTSCELISSRLRMIFPI